MKTKKCRSAVVFALALCFGATTWAQSPSTGETASTATAKKKPSLDRSGKARKGKASFYGKEFHGRKMADGTPMDPNSNIAASRTLPLGTKAIVTNLENGKSEVVEIRDRGPYVDGRIVDLTPQTAEKLDMKKDGLATVEVRPIELPPMDARIKSASRSDNSVEQSSGQ